MRPATFTLLALFLTLTRPAHAYLVAAAVTVDALAKEADVILKGKVTGSEVVADATFKPIPGFAVFATRIRVASILKGDDKLEVVEFRHYAPDPDARAIMMYSPQHYAFEADRSYILFAKATKTVGVLRPLWDSHRARADLGQVLAADHAAIAANTDVKAAIWAELTKLAKSESADDVRYAVRQLSAMSGSGYDATPDFDRAKVVAVVGPLMSHAHPDAAAAAIDAIGGRTPYRNDDVAMGWLATIGKGTLLARGHSTYEKGWDNPDARRWHVNLIQVGDAGPTPAARARAIRALGLVKEDAVLAALRKWSADPAAEVRAAAAPLWADYPGDEAGRAITRLAGDAEASVRASAALAAGYAQSAALLPVLNLLLTDKDGHVRSMAAMSVVSFDPRAADAVLRAFTSDPDFRACFVDALALADAAPWLDDLAQIVTANEEPKLHFTAQMPVYTSWQLLKQAMEKHSGKELASGKLDAYLDALDQPPQIGSGPYQEMYQFYKDKGLVERAKSFRTKAKLRVTSFDIDYYFKRIDGEK